MSARQGVECARLATRAGEAHLPSDRGERPNTDIAKDIRIMPYFVYKISPPLQLEYIDTIERYQDARALVRRRREEEGTGSDIQYRLVFARQQGEAEKLLSTPRDDRVIGED
jgi:hypothetical protein